jgi:DNA modification methylase
LIEAAVKRVPTKHRFVVGDGRSMAQVADESVHLIVTSPPYFDLKKYPAQDAQLGLLHDYDFFLKELDQVWRECFRVLVTGGRTTTTSRMAKRVS